MPNRIIRVGMDSAAVKQDSMPTAIRQQGIELLRPTQVAMELGVSIHTLREWRCRGTGPRFVRMGRFVRYLRKDINAWIERSRRLCTADER